MTASDPNWMIEGAAATLADLSQFGELRLTPEQEQRVNELLAECDRGATTASSHEAPQGSLPPVVPPNPTSSNPSSVPLPPAQPNAASDKAPAPAPLPPAQSPSVATDQTPSGPSE